MELLSILKTFHISSNEWSTAYQALHTIFGFTSAKWQVANNVFVWPSSTNEVNSDIVQPRVLFLILFFCFACRPWTLPLLLPLGWPWQTVLFLCGKLPHYVCGNEGWYGLWAFEVEYISWTVLLLFLELLIAASIQREKKKIQDNYIW